jgi:hypothetical protein
MRIIKMYEIMIVQYGNKRMSRREVYKSVEIFNGGRTSAVDVVSSGQLLNVLAIYCCG